MTIERTITMSASPDPFFSEPNATHLRRAIADMDANRNVVFHDLIEEEYAAHA